ncbi:hypothetical protein MIND_01130400 [Mycena indigotica]|uniref:Uncharacterized protein n=1 Tax=Mycena indigotica TaxID=2126181 RepID=A0A8H6VVK7_9AGAR|nr:uncharacterized protein MIND_01130400 [Mycena indigotica]KAF7293521.1 hypothetical protein MIND_01130400 [Mycena indigotica]
MPKGQHKCDLCNKPLRNLAEAKRVHDRTCPGFKALHLQSVAHVRQHLANAARAPSPPPQLPIQLQAEMVEIPEPPQYRPSGLPNRKRRIPAKLQDAAPAPLPRIRRRAGTDFPVPRPPEAEPSPEPIPEAEPPGYIRTETNNFGLYKMYPRRPTHDPDGKLDTMRLR